MTQMLLRVLQCILLTAGLSAVQAAQAPLSPTAEPALQLISPRTQAYVQSLLHKWSSSGLALAAVRLCSPDIAKACPEEGYHVQFASFGVARIDPPSSSSSSPTRVPVTPDTVFAIASNSKLFLAVSIGLLISNDSLSWRSPSTGERLSWHTRARDVFGEDVWKLWEGHEGWEGVTIQDMLSHRTGLPRHDYSTTAMRKGGLREMISLLRTLRPSAPLRSTFQYNNLMYESLAHLPPLLLNVSYEDYVQSHIFDPLQMRASTFSIERAENATMDGETKTFAQGFMRTNEELTASNGRAPTNGTLIPIIPYFGRPGEEIIWEGAGGVLSSARDLAKWTATLLNKGRHPRTNVSVIPAEVLEYVERGIMVSDGKATEKEFSPRVYASGLWRYTYQSHELLEHGGHNPGFKTQLLRFTDPADNLGVVSLCNDENGGWAMEGAKWRVVEEVLGIDEVAWDGRFEKQYNSLIEKMKHALLPRPKNPIKPPKSLEDLASGTFRHPAYGVLKPCLVPSTTTTPANPPTHHTHPHCRTLLTSPASQQILNHSSSNPSLGPMLLIGWDRTFATHIRLTHFDAGLFNVTVLWGNHGVREREGWVGAADQIGEGGDEGAMMTGFDARFEVEWVVKDGEGEEEGLAFKRGFWGMEGLDAREPAGRGKESAEVWFARVDGDDDDDGIKV